MATVQILIANPTTADVTVNAKVAKKGTVTQLGLDDTTNESEQFLAAKCALVSLSAQSDMQARAACAFMLERLQYRQ